MNKLFQIGSFCFRILCNEDFPIPSNFILFEKRHGISEYTYQLKIADTLPLPDGDIIAKKPDMILSRTPDGESRLLGIKGRDDFYAYYHEISNVQAEVSLSTGQIRNLRIDPVFTSLFALEKRLIELDSLVLHCAYVVCNGKAILFSAPSGIGKSTQADLWERYRSSYTVNGDRALLRKIDNRWTACGWPVCGSSEICNLRDTPIHAIVMLEQSRTNHVEKLSPVQAFTQLYGQITINQWNKDFVQRAILNLENLIKSVPVYLLACDVSEDAVKCLEKAIFIENNEI